MDGCGNDLHMETPEIATLGGSLTTTEEVNSFQKEKRARKKKKGKAVPHKDISPDILLDNSSLKTDAAIKDPLHESPALSNSSSSQRIVEFKSKKKNKKRKRQKTKQKDIESNDKNGCGASNDIFSSKTSTPALDMPSEHPIQNMSTDPVMIEPGVEGDIREGENEEKEHNMLKRAAENSNGECDFQEVSCTPNSVVANAVCFAKESGLEVVKLNVEQGINDNTSNPEDENGFVKNASKEKIHDDNPVANQFSGKFQCAKTYARRKTINSNYGGNCGYRSPVNFNEEPTMHDDHEDDLHKFSDGPSAVGLMDKETKLSRDQVTSHSRVAAEKMMLITDNTSEQRFISTSSIVDINVMQLEEANGRQQDHIDITRNDMCCPGDVSDLSLVSVKDCHSKISHFSLDSTITSNSKNKLLILDVNGLLADFVSIFSRGPQPDLMLRRSKVYKRPFCDDFLQFCFDRFHVGVWSSRAKSNVDKVIEFLMGKSASKLLFCWNQSHCTTTKFTTVGNIHKPLLLKELRKLWEKVDPGLPWEKGEFNESNTLLLDDSPHKALVNPMHTAIFPYSYRYSDTRDASLGPGGDLRVYLEGLAMAENVQEYVSSNPFGQRPIRESNPSWGYYKKVIEAVKGGRNAGPSTPDRH